MAVLPTPRGRGIPAAQNTMARISPGATTGDAMAAFGTSAMDAGFRIQDIDDTAAAKERDRYAADQIRELLYNPESGYAFLNGKDAVAQLGAAQKRLDEIKASATQGMSKGAQRKLTDALEARIDRALGTMSTHAGAQRRSWMEATSQARIEGAKLDVAAGMFSIEEAYQAAYNELVPYAKEKGKDWLDVEARKLRSDLTQTEIMRIASTDPEMAYKLVEEKKKDLGAAYVGLQAQLKPAAVRAEGRRLGSSAFTRLGNMEGLMEIADDALGMDENAQRAALQAYMKDGGVNLDPSTTAWCAAYINATLGKAGMEGTSSNLARSFLNWGEDVTSAPKVGDIVVLSRGGNATYGHVGFLSGFDENGNPIILGGNQGNKVSEQVYSKDRVLGYRRAPNTTQTGGADVELANLLNIKDPDVRNAAVDEFNLRVKVAKGARQTSLEVATTTAFQAIEAGTAPDDFPLNVRQALGMEAMSALRTYHGKIAAKEPVETDLATYYELSGMMAEDPAAFREENLLKYVDRLSPTDFKKLADAQKDPTTTQAASTIRTMVKQKLETIGITTTGTYRNNRKKAASQIDKLQTRMMDWQANFVSLNGRKPEDEEVRKRLDSEITEVAIGGFSYFGKHKMKAFEVDAFMLGDPNDPLDDRDMSDVKSIKIGSREISAEQIRAYGKEMVAGGLTPTSASLFNYIRYREGI